MSNLIIHNANVLTQNLHQPNAEAFAVDNGNIMALVGEAKLLVNTNWKNSLYKEVNTSTKPIKIKLIPYYAWANRGRTDMTVWMPLMR